MNSSFTRDAAATVASNAARQSANARPRRRGLIRAAVASSLFATLGPRLAVSASSHGNRGSEPGSSETGGGEPGSGVPGSRNAPGSSRESSWPRRPVHLIVPAPPGSSLDFIARLLSERLKTSWQQPVVVENKSGAGGTIGMQALARAEPDGQTLGIGFNGPIAFAPFMYRHLSYDPLKDLAPVVSTSSQANVLVVTSSLDVSTPRDFVRWARAERGRLNYASVGAGSSSHLTMAMFARAAGFEATHVPFNGAPPAATSVAAGDTNALFAAYPGLKPLIDADRLKVIATSGAERDPFLKEVPTLAEAGWRDVVSLAWNGIFVPAKTPQPLIERIGRDIDQVLHQPESLQAFAREGLSVTGSDATQFGSFIADESARWSEIIRRAGIALD